MLRDQIMMKVQNVTWRFEKFILERILKGYEAGIFAGMHAMKKGDKENYHK